MGRRYSLILRTAISGNLYPFKNRLIYIFLVKPLIKLGSVSFLNAQPLTYAIEHNLIEHEFDLIQTPPSELSKKLYNKEIDLGLIPVAELLKRKNYKVVPGISISSLGKVDSVIIVAKKDIKELRSIAVDHRSQSSTALLRIVLEIFHGNIPEYIPTDIDNDGMMDDVDGAMLIGDSGLREYHNLRGKYKIYDLGEIWTKETNLPFVYAVFAGNKDVILDGYLDRLMESKSYGLQVVDKICEVESEKLGISYDNCYKYLTDRIRYDLGDEEINGLVKYSEMLEDIGEADRITDLNFYTK